MGLFDRYEARFHRQLTERYGQDRADREARPQMFFALAVFVWVIPTFLATLVRSAGSPGTSLLLYALAIAWLPVVVIAWLRLRRARPN
jgi:hypothetical protein